MCTSMFNGLLDAMIKRVGICLAIGAFLIIAASAQAQVKGPDVQQVTFGSGGVTEGMFVQVNDSTWTRLNPDGSVVAGFGETGRDEWSVYLADSSGVRVILNLWTKQVTVQNSSGDSNYPLLSSASTPYQATATAAAVAPDDSDPVATAVGAVETGVGLSTGTLLGTASESADITAGKNTTLTKMCSVLQAASSGIKGQVDKAALRKAQEDLLDQWAAILYEVQNDSGISVDDLDAAELAGVMGQVQAEIDNDMQGSVEPQDDLIPTDYQVEDPGSTLKKGATEVPVVGPQRFMILNKTIVFKGVPGKYKLTSSYDGTSGTINITPGLLTVPRHTTEILTELEWTSFDIARQALEVAGVADPTGAAAVAAAYLHPVCNTEEAVRSRGDYCYRHSDGRGVGIIPIACNPAVPDRQAGLCYTPCPEGYYGVGPVCWTNEKWSIPRGAGVVPSGCPASHPIFEAGLCYQACDAGWKAVGTICYQQCPSGYSDDGLYCGKTTYNRGAGYVAWDQAKCEADHPDVGCEMKGALWYPKCKPGFVMTTVNFCQTDGCPPGWEDIGVSCKMPSKGRGVGVARNVCAPNVPDFDAGLCYENCPDGYNGVGPVCWTEKATSKPRGAGVIPDQCPPDHPVFDAGLCYSTCPNPEYAGIGPVCWGGCGGRYSEPCGVGCATSTISCGLVTTEMVVAPLEMIASIASLGGYSLVDKAKDSAKIAFKNAVEEATEASVKDMGVTIGQQAVLAAKRNLDKLDNFGKALASRKDLIKKALKENAFDPVKDRAVKSWRNGVENRLQKKIANASNEFQAELIRDGAAKKFVKEAADETLDEIEKDSIRNFSQQVAEEAAKEKASRLLRRDEIKDKLLSFLSKSWNGTDKAWIEMGQQCTEMGLNIAGDWAAAQH